MNWIVSRIPVKDAVKTLFFRPGEQERAVLTGALKGLRFRFDLRSDTQQWRGVYERPLQKWLTEHVRPGSICLDIGAAQGYFTVLMAKLSGPDGAVHAFEPSELCERIAYHAELNGRDHVLAPVSAHKRFVVGDAVQSDPLSATVDEVVARDASLERVDVIKIDVDGAEADVLRGANRTLERFRPHLFVEVHSRDLLNECWRILDGYGYPLRLEDAASSEHRPIEYNAFLFTKDPCMATSSSR
jgi:FkbM family methyltransferase